MERREFQITIPDGADYARMYAQAYIVSSPKDLHRRVGVRRFRSSQSFTVELNNFGKPKRTSEVQSFLSNHGSRVPSLSSGHFLMAWCAETKAQDMGIRKVVGAWNQLTNDVFYFTSARESREFKLFDEKQPWGPDVWFLSVPIRQL